MTNMVLIIGLAFSTYIYMVAAGIIDNCGSVHKLIGLMIGVALMVAGYILILTFLGEGATYLISLF